MFTFIFVAFKWTYFLEAMVSGLCFKYFLPESAYTRVGWSLASAVYVFYVFSSTVEIDVFSSF